MGAAGRKLIEKQFDAALQTEKLEKHYDALVKLWTRTRTSPGRGDRLQGGPHPGRHHRPTLPQKRLGEGC